jgi:parallel beta-helix repeat protein
MKRHFKRLPHSKQYTTSAIAIVLVAAVGIYLFTSSHAQAPFANLEAESGSLGGTAVTQSDTSASGGKDVQFGAAPSSGVGGSAGLGTPDICPAGSVAVSPGNVPGIQANKNYCFASGTYSRFSTSPQTGDGFYGQGHAILDGGGSTASAFTVPENASIANVVIDGFTMQNYYSGDDSSAEYGVVSAEGGSNLTVTDNTIQNDHTTAIEIGGHDNIPCCTSYHYSVDGGLVAHNVIQNIGYAGTTISGTWGGFQVDYNVITQTNTEGEDRDNDVAALGKFADDDGIIVNGNNVYNNNDIGTWYDDYNVGTTITNNTLTNNYVGLMYEISYNATISGNTFIDNGNNYNPSGDESAGAPPAAIRISSSGWVGDGTPTANYGTVPTDGPHGVFITSNTLNNNYEGVVVYSGHPNPTDNISVTGNTVTGSTTGASNAYTMATGGGAAFSDNSYTLTKSIFADPGGTNWSGWKGAGLDSSDSTCKLSGGGSC